MDTAPFAKRSSGALFQCKKGERLYLRFAVPLFEQLGP
jgi:hypothetical protein